MWSPTDFRSLQIEQLVGKINGEFGTLGWTPIVYQYRALLFDSLVAMYAASHVALLTPLRDGMNLVAKEYLASRPTKNGVLAMGDDWADEDTFAVLPRMAYSVRIGNGRTHARFGLAGPGEVVSLLEELIRKDPTEIWKVWASQTSRG